MTNKNKIWYPEEVEKAIEDFYKDTKERSKKKPEVCKKLNNIKADFSIKNNKNFPTMSAMSTPQDIALSLF
jgi:hypothetical protein